MKKIKLIQVIADSAVGGGPKHLLGILKHIEKSKFDILLIAPRGWLTREATKIAGVKVQVIDFKSKFDLASLTKLKKNIAEFRSSFDPFGPIFIHAHGPRAGWFCRFAVRSGERFFYTEHLWNEDFELANFANDFFQKRGLKLICRRADKVIAVSKSVEKFLAGGICDSKKIVVIPNGVEIVEGKKNADENQKEIIIGTIGALNKQKGQIYLVRVMPRILQSFPRARLEIIGEGPERKNLAAEIDRLGLESKIQLLGRQNQPEKFLKTWKVFVLPSLSETFGITILESFQAEVPVVASNVGGVGEIIKNNENGILVSPADSDRLAKAIMLILTEKKLRDLVIKSALVSLKTNYDWNKIITDLEKIYLSN
ncbi:MAG: glycosyltransferase family 4 protein [Candidatus Berkelbacteria bacterium]|nr:glycosyltransferase family 4 protein [Candidatus Berkelbacteria bacterium]